MKNRLLPLTAIAFMATLALKAQNIHFTQFTLVPTALSPAQTGGFEGTYRVGGLYRSQWRGGVQNGYQTPVLYADLPIKGFRKTDWIGVGFTGWHDRAGSAVLRNTSLGLNAAYHIGLDKQYKQVISFGVGYGFVQRAVDESKLKFRDQIQANSNTSQDLNFIDAKPINYSDVNVGINYRNKSKKNTLNLGISAEHVLTPDANLSNVTTTTLKPLPMRLNFYGTMDMSLTKRWGFHPAVIYRTSAGLTETAVQLVPSFKIDPRRNFVLRGGLGYRVNDAAKILAGLDFGDFRVGASYDVTTSALRRFSNIQDGFEVGFGYIGKIFKKPNPPAVILCPRY